MPCLAFHIDQVHVLGVLSPGLLTRSMAQQSALLGDVLYNADILQCVVGHLYRPDAIRVRCQPSILMCFLSGATVSCTIHCPLLVQLLAVCKSLQALAKAQKIEHRPRLLVVASESNCLCELDLLTGELGRTYAVRPRCRGWKRQKGGSLDCWPTCVAMSPDGWIHICQYKV